MTPCDNETVANVDDFPVVDLECSQPLSNGASAFVGENSEKRACILEATSIDTECSGWVPCFVLFSRL